MPVLDNHINNRNAASSSKSMTTPLNKSISIQQSNQKTMAETSGGFQKGQIIKGEIINLRDKDIKIQLDDSRIISAKMDGSHNISIGDRASFQVTEAGLSTMSLKIMSEGNALSKEHMIGKALDEAGLPHTERNINAVNELLTNQLSINKAAIQQFLKQASIYKNASLNTLALMNRLNMPMTQVTTSQFEAYRNYEHRIMNQLDSFTDSLLENNPSSELAENLIYIVSKDTAAESFSTNALTASIHPVSTLLSSEDCLNLTELLDTFGLQEHEKISLLLGRLSIKDTANVILDAMDHIKINEQLDKITEKLLFDTTDTNVVNINNNIELYNPDSASHNSFPAAVNLELLNTLPQALQKPEVFTVLEHYIAAGRENSDIITFLSLSERSQLLQSLSPLNLSETATGLIRNGDFTAKELLPLFTQLINTSEENAKGLLNNPVYKSVMKELLLSHWTLTPKSLTKPDIIDDYYKQLDEELSILEKYKHKDDFRQSEGSKNTFGNSPDTASNVRENIDFMKTLNQMFAYFQMPMKLSGQNIHSELYVYTNKKSLLQNKDSIRVLLHLDMMHLGPLDIHIELNHNNISTKFYIEQSDTETIISDNLSILTDTLTKKGYTHNFEVLKRNKEIDIVEEFISPKESDLDMKRYTFDIRA